MYVDDIILTGDHKEEISKLKRFLANEFEVRDLGNLKYFLRWKLARSKKSVVVSQHKYVLYLLKEIGMLGCKPLDSPMEILTKDREERKNASADKGRYQRLVGKLIHLSHTRLDIDFMISLASQFMNNPTEEHMN